MNAGTRCMIVDTYLKEKGYNYSLTETPIHELRDLLAVDESATPLGVPFLREPNGFHLLQRLAGIDLRLNP